MRRSTGLARVLGSALITAALGCSSSSGGDQPAVAAGAGGGGGAAGSGAAGGAAGSAGGGGAAGMPAAGPAIQARFTLPSAGLPRYLDVPFPSDIYLSDPDGTVADVIPGFGSDASGDGVVDVGADHLLFGTATMKGFGVTSGACFRIDDLGDAQKPAAAVIDPASLPKTEAETMSEGAAALLLDLSPSDPSKPFVPAQVAVFDNRARGSRTPPVVTVSPARGVVLAEGHRYAAVLTTHLLTASGAAVGASPHLADIRDGKARATPSEQAYGAAIDLAVALVPGLAQSLVAIAPFTTLDESGDLLAMRETVKQAGPSLQLSWKPADALPMASAVFGSGPKSALPAGYTATLDDWLGAPDKLADGRDDPAADQPNGRAHSKLSVVGTAVFEAPNFLLVDDAMQYADVKHNTVARGPDGRPRVNPDKPTNKIWITLALPDAPVPPAGFPVVIIQHGIGGDRHAVLELANVFAERGWASVGIEAVTHGARATSDPSLIVDKTAWRSRSKFGVYDGPDGFVDKTNGPVDFFGSLLSIAAIRDQLRQSALDYCSVAELLSNPSLDLGPLLARAPGARLDPSRIGYVGNSLSGIIGAIVAGIDPLIKSFVLNVAGGGLISEIGVHAPQIAVSLGTAVSFNFGFSKDTPVHPAHPMTQYFQSIVDPGDPLLFARRIVTSPASIAGAMNPPKNVLQYEVLWDQLVANEGNEALARAAGFGLADPSTGPIAGVALLTAPASGGVVSNFPQMGVTAVVVQASPATHGGNLVNRHGTRQYARPYGQFDTKTPFAMLPAEITINEPYLALQATAVGFLAGAFAGGGAPPVAGFPVPVRDFAGDGMIVPGP